MSTEEVNDFTVDEVFTRPDGSGILAMNFGSEEMANNFKSKARVQTSEKTEGAMMTPHGDIDSEVDYQFEKTAPVKRAVNTMTHIGAVGLETICRRNHELSSTINRLSDETFKQDVPVLEPIVEDADENQKEYAEAMFRSINDAGQSLHGLLRMVVQDHARLGTGMIVVRKNYVTFEDQIVQVNVEELVRGDPKRIVPITDSMNQVGGLYACPKHRKTELSESEGRCKKCGCEYKEVTYARTASVGGTQVETVFFDDEVISFSFHNTLLQGRDGLPPAAGVWKQAYLLDQMRNYVGQYFSDDDSQRYPNTLLFIDTSNVDALKKQARKAKDSRQANAYESGIIMGENADFSIEVVDMMNDKIIGQRPQLKEEFKSDIRNAYGIPAIVDDDEESASLASGSKGLDVLTRSINALRTNLEREVLSELEDVFGLTDWTLTFKPEQDEEEKMTGLEKAEMAQRLSKAGVPFRVEDGTITLVDTDSPLDESSDETEGTEQDALDNDRTEVNL